MPLLLRGWIVEVLKAHPGVTDLACRQRAKLEGWLKFELAQQLIKAGATNLEVEPGYKSGERCDLAFTCEGQRYAVELKTANTNFRLPGVAPLMRPITMNLDAVARDVSKLRSFGCPGLAAFVLFPIPPGDERWKEYVLRIANKTEGPGDPGEYSTVYATKLESGHDCEMVVTVLPVA